MAEQIESPAATHAHQIFGNSHCERISYDIRVKTNEVNAKDFFEATKSTHNGFGFAHCAPRYAETDYHLHVSWSSRKETFSIEIEFVKGRIKKPDKDPEPFAEDFIEWVEKFFLLEKVRVRVDADFLYPAELRQSKFPLPARVPIGPRNAEVEIDGISFALLDKPTGIVKVWMTQRPERFLVHIHADKEMDLRSIDPRKDITAIEAVLDTMLEPKSTGPDNVSEPKELKQ